MKIEILTVLHGVNRLNILWSNSVTWLHMYSLVFLSLERGFFCLTCIPRTEHITLTMNLKATEALCINKAQWKKKKQGNSICDQFKSMRRKSLSKPLQWILRIVHSCCFHRNSSLTLLYNDMFMSIQQA